MPAKRIPEHLKKWHDEVAKVKKMYKGITHKEAMMIASKLRKQRGGMPRTRNPPRRSTSN